jgi:hypothetical protein
LVASPPARFAVLVNVPKSEWFCGAFIPFSPQTKLSYDDRRRFLVVFGAAFAYLSHLSAIWLSPLILLIIGVWRFAAIIFELFDDLLGMVHKYVDTLVSK